MKNIPVSVVMPVYNEAGNISRTIQLISKQTIIPAELIIVDGGSIDGTLDLIRDEWIKNTPSGCELVTEIVPGAYPGGGRNKGIELAKTEWIVFLDAGIYPESDWLEKLWLFREEKGVDVIFGQCDFDSDHPMGKAVCAVSYGVGKIHSTIPGAIIKKSIFEKVGFFREDLRSAEDLEWRGRLNDYYGSFPSCDAAVIHYREVPVSLIDVYNKWYRNSVNTVYSGKMKLQVVGYIFMPFFLAVIFLYDSSVVNIVIFMYIFFRGIVDPIRRSRRVVWWNESSISLYLAPLASFVIDTAKFIGYVMGVSYYARRLFAIL